MLQLLRETGWLKGVRPERHQNLPPYGVQTRVVEMLADVIFGWWDNGGNQNCENCEVMGKLPMKSSKADEADQLQNLGADGEGEKNQHSKRDSCEMIRMCCCAIGFIWSGDENSWWLCEIEVSVNGGVGTVSELNEQWNSLFAEFSQELHMITSWA